MFKYKLTVQGISGASCLFIFAAFFTIQTESVLLFSINLAFIGFTVIPIIPISYGFAVELTYPI